MEDNDQTSNLMPPQTNTQVENPDDEDQMGARINIRVVIRREVIGRVLLMLFLNAFRIFIVLVFFGGLESFEKFKMLIVVLISYFIIKHIYPPIIGNRLHGFLNSST